MCVSTFTGEKQWCRHFSAYTLYVARQELASGPTEDAEEAFMLFSQQGLLTKAIYLMLHRFDKRKRRPNEQFERLTNTSRILILIIRRNDELRGLAIAQLLRQEDVRERTIKYLVGRGDWKKSELTKLPTEWIATLI